MKRKLKFGVALPIWDWNRNCRARNDEGGTPIKWQDVVERAKLCEELGYDSILVNDHLFRGKGGHTLEGWTTISALATVTRSIKLSQVVLCNGFRNPALLAKMASTLDFITNGRLELGIGAGWMKDEFTQYGYPFPSNNVRIEQLKEAVEIIERLFTQTKTTYAGKYYSVTDATCEPKPIQKPHPTIWIGGGGELYTLQVVARLADGWNWSGSPSTMARKLEILEGYCRSVRRNFSEIKKSVGVELSIARTRNSAVGQLLKAKPDMVSSEDYIEANIVGTPAQCAEKIQEYLDLGIDHFVIAGYSKLTGDELKLFAQEVVTCF